MATPFEPQPCAGAGSGEPGLDVEGSLICDIDAEGNVLGVALVEAVYDGATGTRTGTRLVSVIDGTPYVPQGTMQPCPEGCCPEPVVLCDVQEDGSTVQFIRSFTGQADGGLSITDQLLDGSVYAPTGTVGSCDPYATCTPTSDQDLNAECGPGESPNQDIVADDGAHPLANAVYVDDESADGLCGGEWDRPSSPLVAPFPVDESFRNTTFDQPGPVLQGTAPYPDLTADVDGAGAGWLQVADINSGTNGLWQVPSAFPTSEGMNAAITFASHDGTTPGGDGMAFVFTDGSVPAQSIPVGGFGNLGLQNWQGGYVAVVLDEYGQTCTCSQAAQGVIDPNPGPCGFCTNTISIQLAGAARQGASCACCTVASLPLAPKALNQTTRSTPARLLVSIIEEGGQTYVSASVDWNDGNGAVQYFDRVNVTACAGPPPNTLRMAAYGGSGGSYRAVKEMRDAVARPAGVSNWRSFPFTTDAIPECTSLVNVRACVDVTFNNDTQETGNGDPEAYLLLVDTQTNTVLDRDVQSSIPSQVGNPNQLCVQEAVPPAKVPFLRVYVGAESRDQNGEYDQLWENLEITATGTGCPAVPRRTLEVSARCPLPVTIVGGSGEGGGGGTTVVNTPATFEDVAICATIGGVEQSGFRREVRAPDGTNTVSFLGVDGLPITPDSWTPGPCCCEGEIALGEVCYTTPELPFSQRGFLTRDADGTAHIYNQSGVEVTPFPTVVICPENAYFEEILCDEGNDGHAFIRRYVGSPIAGANAQLWDFELDGSTAYVPVGPVGRCDDCARLVLGQVCVSSDSFPGVTLPATAVQACDGTVSFLNANTGDPWPGTVTVVVCPPDNQTWEEILCDAGNGGQQFRRVYNLTSLGSVPLYDEDLDANPYAVVGPVESCAQVDRVDAETQILCDANGTRFLRTYAFDAAGVVSGFTDRTLAGAAFAPVGAVGVCAQTVQSDTDFVEEILCDSNGTAFIRLFRFNSSTGALISTTNTTLAGAAFVPVGVVGVCSDCCPQVIGNGCTNTGSGFYTAIRATNGTITLIDSVTGAAVLAANIVPCPSDDTTQTLTAQARLVADADAPWTPGADVVGTLTSVTMTVLSGTATLTDQNGTVLAGLPAGFTATWSAEDDNTLSGPTSIDAVGGSTVVHWTQR